MANAFFGLILSLLLFFLYFADNIKIAVMKELAQKMHQSNISGMFWKSAVMKIAVMIHYLKNKVGVVDFANAQGVVMF